MAKIDFKNNFPKKKSKILGPFSPPKKIFEKSNENWKFQNFEKYFFESLKFSIFITFSKIFFEKNIGPKFFEKFSENYLQNQFSPWKFNIFCPGFFSWQGMDGYYRFRTSVRLAFAYITLVPKKTIQIPWFCTYRDLFASGFIYLALPYGFLSMIFGFLGKFRIDIEKNPWKKSEIKTFCRKSWKIFFETKHFPFFFYEKSFHFSLDFS